MGPYSGAVLRHLAAGPIARRARGHRLGSTPHGVPKLTRFQASVTLARSLAAGGPARSDRGRAARGLSVASRGRSAMPASRSGMDHGHGAGSATAAVGEGRRSGMRRREFLALAAGAATLVARVPRARADSGSCIWGIGDTYTLDSNFATYCAQLEGELGREFAGFRLNGGFQKATSDFNEMHRMITAGRRWTYVNGKPSGTVSGYWKAIAAGTYDSALNQFIQRVLSDPSWTNADPMRFSFHHEQYVKAEGGGIAAGTAQDFIAAYRHVRGLVDQAGAHVSAGGNI